MELIDIITLVKAGYTKDEIAQMDKPQTPDPNTVPVQLPVNVPEQSPKPAPTPAPVVQPVAVAQPIPQPQPAPAQPQPAQVQPQPAQVQPQPALVQPQPAQVQPQPTMEDLMQSIAKLTSAVQANAIAQSVIPQGLQNPPKAEDMLAEIIRPTFHQRGE